MLIYLICENKLCKVHHKNYVAIQSSLSMHNKCLGVMYSVFHNRAQNACIDCKYRLQYASLLMNTCQGTKAAIFIYFILRSTKEYSITYHMISYCLQKITR